jgi:hypothetical protein
VVSFHGMVGEDTDHGIKFSRLVGLLTVILISIARFEFLCLKPASQLILF